MTFTIINTEIGDLNFRGYQFVGGSSLIINDKSYAKIISEQGEDYADYLIDIFSDSCFEPICIGEDNKFYAVMFDLEYTDNGYIFKNPIMWQAVELVPED